VRVLPRFLYLGCFIALGAVSALALDRVVQPSMSAVLLRAVFLAAFCAAPGLIWRRLWPLAIVLLPVGCYFLLRTTVPVPTSVHGLGGQLDFYLSQLRQGITAYETTLFPLPVREFPELQVLLAFSAYWLFAAAAFLALSLRRAVPAVVLVLTLLGYGLTTDNAPRVLWPALVFGVLSVCLIVICRGLTRGSWRPRDIATGGLVGVAAAVLALGLMLGAPSVAATPWQDWRTWDPFGQGTSMYTFNWLENYPLWLDPSKNVVIMQVRSPLPTYWRANALDTFKGTAWVTSQAFLSSVQETTGANGYTYALPPTELMPAGETVTETFQIRAVKTNYFFAGGDPQALDIGLKVDLRMNNMRSLRVSNLLGPALDYSLTAVIPRVKPADLVGLGTDYPDELDRYRSLPWGTIADLEGPDKDAEWRNKVENGAPDGWEWTELYSLNRRVVGEATDPYEITLLIERYLRRNFTYSLEPPTGVYFSPYAAFLFDHHTGYCQHFAGVMALLLRYNGIPARVAVGFTTGTAGAAGTYLVSTNNAHAWVEAYFPRMGWVNFDPTPGRSIPTAGGSSTSPGFVDPFGGRTPPGPGTVDTIPTPTTLPDGGQTGGGLDTPSGQQTSGRATWVPWVAVMAALGAIWPLIRGLWRHRRLHRGAPDRRLEASLALLRADLSDHGVPITPAHTLDEALQVLQGEAGVAPDLVLVRRADSVLFGGRRASPEDLRRAESFRAQVGKVLRSRRSWFRTVCAWYGVPCRQTRTLRTAGHPGRFGAT
jgi:transglutaminase-like putative cysteine protease